MWASPPTIASIILLYHRLPKGARSARRRIDSLRAEEVDDKLIGQTHDVRSAGAEAPLHAVVVWAGCLRHGDFAVLNSDNIYAAIFGGYGKLLILMEIYCFHHFSAAGNLDEGSIRPGSQYKKAPDQAEQEHGAHQQNPRFGFHEPTPRFPAESTGGFQDSIAKLWEKRK